jgi:hypothetical protein
MSIGNRFTESFIFYFDGIGTNWKFCWLKLECSIAIPVWLKLMISLLSQIENAIHVSMLGQLAKVICVSLSGRHICTKN